MERLNIIKEYPILINFITYLCTTVVAYWQLIVLDNINLFLAIFLVVLFDFIFGVLRAWQNKCFETRKAMKLIYYLSTYWMILVVVLAIENAHEAAFWISEAVILPLMLFQLISGLKNAAQAGAISQSMLLTLLENIDKHKDRAIENLGDIVTEAKKDDNQENEIIG